LLQNRESGGNSVPHDPHDNSAVVSPPSKSITPHDLRHTCASLAVSAGVNVLALQRMLGHTSAKMTLDNLRGPV
jgi:integrase